MWLPIDISEPLRRRMARVGFQTEHAVSIVFPQEGGMTGVYASSRASNEEITRLCDSVTPGMICFSRSRRAAEQLLLRGWRMDLLCHVAFYDGPAYEEHLPSEVSFRWLTMDDFPVVVETYHNPTISEEALRKRVEGRVMLGVCVDGTLAGYIGEHTEGKIGLLEIFPPFRRRHLTTFLEQRYCNLLLSQGEKPFCDIIAGNTSSTNLHTSLGFRFEHPFCWWLS
jgi:hypothetical protein